ncbi:hypothetical protein CPC08DRAFT_129425 [Agrocybe pediades]|nr:hypothetical protein CPC08DRAFT_129425 [Agrocybe pediades]
MPLYRPQMLDPPSLFPAMSSPPTRTTPSIASGQPMPSYRSQTVPALVPSSFSPPSPSYPPLLSPRSPLPNPHSQPVMNAQSSEILLEQDVEEPESHTPYNDATFDIGMAMLQPDGLQPQTPTIFLDPGASDEQEFDPYDPAHLELEHSRTPSPLPNPHVAPERSRRSSPEPHDHQNSSVESAGQKETLDKRDDDKSASPQQHTREPPPYEFSVPEDVPERGQAAQAVGEPRSLSQRSSPRSNVNQDLLQENNSSRQENITTQDHAGRTSSAHHNLNNFNLTPPLEQATSSYSRPPPPPAQPIYRQNNEHPQNQPQNHPPPALPETDFANFRNPMHPPSQPASVYSRDRDVRSTHHSISTYSSSQSRNGPPPPHRRVPKHLVMPAPLNTNPMNQHSGMVNNRPQSNYMPAQIPSVPQIPSAKVQVHLRSQSHLPFPQPPTMLAHSQPMSTRPQPGSSNKLKKRVSMFGSSTPSAGKQLPTPQAVTTVSFAPPIVGFSQGPYSEKAMARSKTEKLAKGMLRKGGKGDF